MNIFVLIKDAYSNRNIIQKVLYIGDKPLKMSNRINFPNLTFSYELVNTKDISCKELMQSENLNNNILAALCHTEDEEKYLVEIFDRIFSLEENDKEDYLTKLLTILEARPKLKRVLIKLKEENKMLITYTEKMI